MSAVVAQGITTAAEQAGYPVPVGSAVASERARRDCGPPRRLRRAGTGPAWHRQARPPAPAVPP